jgi:hypothetical protein
VQALSTPVGSYFYSIAEGRIRMVKENMKGCANTRYQSPSAIHEECRITISHLSQWKPTVYLIIDGIDELSPASPLLEFVNSLAIFNAKVFLTSRNSESIKEQLSGLALVNIDVDPNLVDIDIEKYIDHEFNHNAKLHQIKPKMQMEIREKLLEKGAGMYVNTNSKI